MLPPLIFLLELLFIIALILLEDYLPGTKQYLEDHVQLSALLNFVFYVAIIDAIRRAVRFTYAKKHGLPRDKKANFQYGINNIAKLLIILGLVVCLFQLFGVDIKALLTSLSIVAAAIAIISKEYIADFLVGLYFSFSKDFEINDYVRIGEYKGKITELQMLKMRILNDDDHSVLIPNTKVYNNEIINYTKRDIRLMSIDFQINISNVGDLEVLETELASSLSDFGEFIEPNSFNLRIMEMKKDHIDLKFLYKLKRFDRDMQQQIRKKTVRQVFNHIAGKVVGGSGSVG